MKKDKKFTVKNSNASKYTMLSVRKHSLLSSHLLIPGLLIIDIHIMLGAQSVILVRLSLIKTLSVYKSKLIKSIHTLKLCLN